MIAHPAAETFPLMDAARFEELKADIKANGQRVPIVIYQGKILDGRNRYRACKALGIEPRTKLYSGNKPFSYVWSLNGERRDLSDEVRAACLIKAEPHLLQETSAKVAKAANEKRSEAAKEQPRASAGKFVASPPTKSGGTGSKNSPERGVAGELAKKSGINRPAIERQRQLRKERPDLAEEQHATSGNPRWVKPVSGAPSNRGHTRTHGYAGELAKRSGINRPAIERQRQLREARPDLAEELPTDPRAAAKGEFSGASNRGPTKQGYSDPRAAAKGEFSAPSNRGGSKRDPKAERRARREQRRAEQARADAERRARMMRGRP